MISSLLNWLRAMREAVRDRFAMLDAQAEEEVDKFHEQLADYPRSGGRHRLPSAKVTPTVTERTIPRAQPPGRPPWQEANAPEVHLPVVELWAGSGMNVVATTSTDVPALFPSLPEPEPDPEPEPEPEPNPWPKGMTGQFRAVDEYVRGLPSFSRDAG